MSKRPEADMDNLALEPLVFQGQLWRISQDHEGESRVTFAVPLSELPKVLTLGQHTQQLLTITVQVDQ